MGEPAAVIHRKISTLRKRRAGVGRFLPLLRQARRIK